LEFNVEGASARRATVHRTQNLDVRDRVESEPARYVGLDQFDDARVFAMDPASPAPASRQFHPCYRTFQGKAGTSD
jgi:hypothetical protein